jgi:hypothetical protein
VLLDLVGVFDQRQSGAAMAGLAPGAATGFFAEGFGGGFGQSIGGRRLVAVGAVAGQSFLQGQEHLDEGFRLAAGQRQEFCPRQSLHKHKAWRKSGCRG